MKKHGLFLATVATFLFGGLWMAQAGWFEEQRPAPRPAAQRPAQVRTETQDSCDPMTSSAATRYRKNQSGYWKTAMVYR
jgi:hypothetical protein